MFAQFLSKMRLQIWSFVSLLLICLADVEGLDYDDITIIQGQCPPQDTCLSNETDIFVHRNCECDPECLLYHDCCIDAPMRQFQQSRVRRKTNVKCMSYGKDLFGVYSVDRCHRIWQGPSEVRRKCERTISRRDPIMAAPATDPLNGITYKNRYCAECNNVDPSSLMTWRIGLKCDSFNLMNSSGTVPSNYPEGHLIFKTTYPYRNTWGVYFWNFQTNRMDFHPCKMTFQLPEYLDDYVRFCRPGVTSTCAPEWRLHVLRQQCDAYMAVVYVNGVPFRNPHCVLCNNLDLRTRSCSAGIISRAQPSHMSFTMLLDVNTRDGNTVGMVEQAQCSQGEKWDPFSNKCRALVCALPGYKMVNGRCVK